jgi:hypothetical protein
MKKWIILFSANCFCKPLHYQFINGNDNGRVTYFGECFANITLPAIGSLVEANCRRQHNGWLPQIFSLQKSTFLKSQSYICKIDITKNILLIAGLKWDVYVAL